MCATSQLTERAVWIKELYLGLACLLFSILNVAGVSLRTRHLQCLFGKPSWFGFACFVTMENCMTPNTHM